MASNVPQKAVENGLSMAREELLPIIRHQGILSLPVEVIVHVLRQVYDDDSTCATESILLVNRYFRDIAIGTPDLWTRLTSGRNPRLFIERSRSLGLEVDLSADRGPGYRRFLQIVAPEAGRWTSLTIPSCQDLDVEEFEWTRDVLAGKTFTTLRVLRIEERSTFYGSLLSSKSLCDGWSMPSLRIIRSKNTLPSIQSASLTCFHLYVNCYTHEIDLVEITKFLQSVPSLTELSLGTGWFDTVTFCTGIEVTLPNVKTLRLTVQPEEDADSSLTNFLTSLHTPNLSDLSVNVATGHAYQLTGWISEIFPEENGIWPSLETLDLAWSYQFHDYDEDSDEDCEYDSYSRSSGGTSAPDDLLQRIPAVRHLSISAVKVGSPDPTYWNVQLPYLRTLRFRRCNKFNTDFILGIYKIFEAPGFETLKIHNCKNIDTEVVRKMMPEGKVLECT